ncbi:MAG: DUF4386 family protein [Sphingomonadales bacterium]|nr:MAG: DUF4386 family protein [Sphingomonadales bacterium]
MRSTRITGGGAIVLAIAFNVPFSILASIYDYPDILRRPAGEALDRFAAGGPALILTWYGFALAAMALVPMTIALSVTRERIAARPALAIGAAVIGALAGLAQAIGLLRWVFVIPGLAHAHVAGTPEAQAAAERAFDLLNAYGGVAIGEHLGQLLTALFVGQLAALQYGERARITAGIGFATALTLVAGTGEGLALSLGADGSGFAMATIAGFMGLTLWLIATGVGLIRKG